MRSPLGGLMLPTSLSALAEMAPREGAARIAAASAAARAVSPAGLTNVFLRSENRRGPTALRKCVSGFGGEATFRVRGRSSAALHLARVELVPEGPDPVHVALAGRVDAVLRGRPGALVVRGKGQVGIVELVEVVRQQPGTEVGVVVGVV